jgi:hypothetical protein
LRLEHLDGRTGAAKRVRELIGALAVDLAHDLTAGQRQLVQRAAVLGAICENDEALWAAGQDIDVPTYLSAINAQRRVLATIGLERRSRDVTPSLGEYLARKGPQTVADELNDTDPSEGSAELAERTSGRPFDFAHGNQDNQVNQDGPAE